MGTTQKIEQEQNEELYNSLMLCGVQEPAPRRQAEDYRVALSNHWVDMALKPTSGLGTSLQTADLIL